jgi:hypothetical protein
MIAHAWLGTTTAAAIYRRGPRDVILPGFESSGLDVREAKDPAARRGWID